MSINCGCLVGTTDTIIILQKPKNIWKIFVKRKSLQKDNAIKYSAYIVVRDVENNWCLRDRIVVAHYSAGVITVDGGTGYDFMRSFHATPRDLWLQTKGSANSLRMFTPIFTFISFINFAYPSRIFKDQRH